LLYINSYSYIIIELLNDFVRLEVLTIVTILYSTLWFAGLFGNRVCPS